MSGIFSHDRAITDITIDKIAAMEVPEEPLGDEIDLTDAEVPIIFPDESTTHYLVIPWSDVPFFWSLHEGGTETKNKFRHYARNSLSFKRKSRFDRIYVRAAESGATGKLYVSIGN